MQNQHSQREISKNNMQNSNQSFSEENEHYRKNHLKSTKSNECKAGKTPKKNKKSKEYANAEENGNNENYDDLLYDNPIIKKRRKHKYRIDPLSVPRPNVFDELYRNDSKEYIFLTDEITKSNIPHSNSFFITNETENSNIRFLRPTFHTLPVNYKFCVDTGLLFGFYLQPFADLLENEYHMETSQGSAIQMNIPVVEVTSGKGIFKCKKCQAIINNKFEIKDEEYPKKTLICNICLTKSELKQNDEGVKDEYFHPDLSNLDELYCPTVDFKIFDPLELEKMKSLEFENTVYHLFMIINSILSNVQQIARNSEEARNQQKNQIEMCNAQRHKQMQAQSKMNNNYNNNTMSTKNSSNNYNYTKNNNYNDYNINSNSDSFSSFSPEKEIKIAFALFSESTIYFAYLDQKTRELKFCLTRDLQEPFTPVARSALFFSSNLLLNQSFNETLTEKLLNFLTTRNKNDNSNTNLNKGAAFSASIFAGLDCFNACSLNASTSKKQTFNHLHVFTCSRNAGGAGFFAEGEYIKKYSSENEIKLFLPEAGAAAPLLEKIQLNSVTLNCFVCGFTQANYLDMQVNLPTFFDVCSKSGGRGFYYRVVNKLERFNDDVKLGYQKLHYDLSAVLNKKVYYDVRISLKHASEFSVSDVFYSVGNSVNEVFSSGFASAFENLGNFGTSLLSNITSSISRDYISNNIHNTSNGISSSSVINNNNNLNDLNSNLNKFKEKGVIYLPSVNSDFNVLYNFKYSKTLKEERKYGFQFIVSYIDPMDENVRKIRVFNYGVFPNEIYFKIYSFLDIDVMVKLILAKEIADSLTEKNKNVCCFEKVKENLKKKLIDGLYFYKKNCSSSASYDQLTLPSALRYFPLFIDSIFKKPFMRKIKNNIHPNTIYNFIYEIFVLPMKYTSKILYPRLFRIDNVLKNKTRCPEDYYFTKQNVGLQHEDLPIIVKPFIYALSLDSVEFNNAFLLDDGLVLSIIVFSRINQMFVYENFGFDNYEQLEKINLENSDFNVDRYFQGQNEMEINVRITNIINQIRKDNSSFYQPIKLILINENNCLNEDFLSLFVEDEYKEEIPYIDFLCNIHNVIVEKLKLDEDDD